MTTVLHPLAAALQAAPDIGLTTVSQSLAILANIIKILEGVVIGFGAFTLLASRKERREADARSAALARKAANYQAWQVVNGAFGKGGSGGRVDALQDLVANDVSLAGVQLDGAWLEGIALRGARLRMASFRGTQLMGADLTGAGMERADLSGAQLSGATLRGAFLRQANVAGAALGAADLSGADLAGLVGWREIATIAHANLEDVRSPPPGFREWALAQGAVDGESRMTDTMSQGFSTSFRAV